MVAEKELFPFICVRLMYFRRRSFLVSTYVWRRFDDDGCFFFGFVLTEEGLRLVLSLRFCLCGPVVKWLRLSLCFVIILSGLAIVLFDYWSVFV